MKSGKIICVIGGTSGIGKAIAHGFVRNGDTVIVSGRDYGKLTKTFDELKSAGNFTDIKQECDVRKKSSLEKLCNKIISNHKKIDVLVVSSGIHKKQKALDMSLKDWKEIIDLNLTGTFLADQVFGKVMVKKKKGCIINIGSLASFVALTDVSAYSASKGGVVMLTKSLAVEWAKKGVRVNAIIPGVVRTELNKKALQDPKRLNNIIGNTPMGRLGDANEIVSTALYLGNSASSFVTGACIPVDGGFLAWAGF
ncbi:MAG: SDR family oxidoreductase [Candidatus Aureabacteria bacterium]|nr:SDR family oxidoreductase [Candidatus Auribacterota bacterium]